MVLFHSHPILSYGVNAPQSLVFRTLCAVRLLITTAVCFWCAHKNHLIFALCYSSTRLLRSHLFILQSDIGGKPEILENNHELIIFESNQENIKLVHTRIELTETNSVPLYDLPDHLALSSVVFVKVAHVEVVISI